jgi:hypothetical protein
MAFYFTGELLYKGPNGLNAERSILCCLNQKIDSRRTENNIRSPCSNERLEPAGFCKRLSAKTNDVIDKHDKYTYSKPPRFYSPVRPDT